MSPYTFLDLDVVVPPLDIELGKVTVRATLSLEGG